MAIIVQDKNFEALKNTLYGHKYIKYVLNHLTIPIK